MTQKEVEHISDLYHQSIVSYKKDNKVLRAEKLYEKQQKGGWPRPTLPEDTITRITNLGVEMLPNVWYTILHREPELFNTTTYYKYKIILNTDEEVSKQIFIPVDVILFDESEKTEDIAKYKYILLHNFEYKSRKFVIVYSKVPEPKENIVCGNKNLKWVSIPEYYQAKRIDGIGLCWD